MIKAKYILTETRRRTYPLAYKIEFLAAWDECVEYGEKARLLRENGLDSTTVHPWLKGTIHKGFVRFIGVGILATHSPVRQIDTDGVSFKNIAFDIRLCPLHETDGRVDWAWINNRRDETLSAGVANLRAPYAWRHWIETGQFPA